MLVSRRNKKPMQRKKAGLKALNAWLNQPHPTGIANKVMSIVREGRCLLDWMDSKGWFVKRRPGGKVFHDPQITSSDIDERATKLQRLMSQLRFGLAIRGADSMSPNALWLEIRPTATSGTWERATPFAIPSDQTDHASGDRDAWVALNNLMRIAPEGNFPQRCSAPLPRGGGPCGRWFVKITPEQHSCSTRCRQRKIEATKEYKAEKAKKQDEYRKGLKNREQKGLEIVIEEAQRAKKR